MRSSVVASEAISALGLVLDPSKSALVVIDIQEKVLPPIHEKDRLLRNTKLLVRLANILNLPVLFTTQYAKGLGGIVPEIASLAVRNQAVQHRAIDKLEFSCFGSDEFCSAARSLPDNRNTLLLCGMETPYLRDADRSGRTEQRLSGACGVGRCGLPVGMELESWIGSHAPGRCRDLLDRNDALRAAAFFRHARF